MNKIDFIIKRIFLDLIKYQVFKFEMLKQSVTFLFDGAVYKDIKQL